MTAKIHDKVLPRDIDTRKQALLENEHDNFPKTGVPGATTMHSFITDKKVLNNEECSERNPDGSFVLSDLEVLGLAEEPIATIDPNCSAKCCRGVYHLTTKQLAGIMRVHGQGIKLYQAAKGADEEDGTPNDPSWGWDMQNPAEGYPCVALQPDGTCGWHEAGHIAEESGKPTQCKMFPRSEAVLLQVEHPITTCSYKFNAQGKRSGACDGCKGT